jgi:photosystem II stability/assembly factor-like uncharacterized protein
MGKQSDKGIIMKGKIFLPAFLFFFIAIIFLITIPSSGPVLARQQEPSVSPYFEAAGTWSCAGPYGGYINNFAAAPSNGDIIYAGGYAGVFKTIDGGATWNKTNAPDLGWDYNRHDPGNPDIAVHPTNPDIAYIGTFGSGIYKTTNGGISWNPTGLAGQKVNAIAIHPTNPDIVLAGTGDWLSFPDGNEGIYKSTDGGANWTLKEQGSFSQVNCLLFDPSDPTRAYAGWIFDEFTRSTDTGDSWSKVYGQLLDEVYALAATPAGHSPATLYANSGSGQSGELYKSTDQGLTWTKIPHPLNEEFEDGKALAVDPNSPNLVYIGMNCYESGVVVYDSTAGTWTPINTGLPDKASCALHVYASSASVQYIAFERGGLYQSTNGGTTWNPVAMKTPTITDLAVHPSSPDTVIASTLGQGNQMYKTTDGGGTWTVLSSNPTNIGALTYDPNNPTVIWAGEGKHNGYRTYIYQSVDGGASWARGTLFNSGSYVEQGISDLWINPNDSNHMIFAVASHTGGGIYLNTTPVFSPYRTFTYWTSAVAADPSTANLLYLGSSKSGYVYKSPDGGVTWDLISPGGVWVSNIYGLVVDADHNVYAATDGGLHKWTGSGTTWTKLSGFPTDNITAIAIDRSTSPETIYAGTDGFGIFKTQNGGTDWTSLGFPAGRTVTKLTEGNNPEQKWVPTTEKIYAGSAFGGVWTQSGTPALDDLLGTWGSQGVYCRNSETAAWTKLASPAEKITCGDLDGDGLGDLIGVWSGQGGVWIKYSSTGVWAKLSSTADWIGKGDMNGDGCDDLLGTWAGQGVYYRNTQTGSWIKIASPADKTAAGDLDSDGTDDLIGIWPTQGGVWVKYSSSGLWDLLSSTADWICTGDMNGDGRADLLGSWGGQGVYYRNSADGGWIKTATAASQITAGDLDGDGTDDLIGIWAGQGGVWIKYSSSGAWGLLSSTADWIACGEMINGSGSTASLKGDMGGPAGGSVHAPYDLKNFPDLSLEGPGGRLFKFRTEGSLVPVRQSGSSLIPGPGLPGFRCIEEGNLIPPFHLEKKRHR